MTKISWKNMEEAVKALGMEEAFSCLVTGYKQKWYRKQQNSKNAMLLELAKNDPRFRQQVAEELKKKSA